MIILKFHLHIDRDNLPVDISAELYAFDISLRQIVDSEADLLPMRLAECKIFEEIGDRMRDKKITKTLHVAEYAALKSIAHAEHPPANLNDHCFSFFLTINKIFNWPELPGV